MGFPSICNNLGNFINMNEGNELIFARVALVHDLYHQ